MTEGSYHFLNELTIWKLKIVAEEYGVDVSTCKHKRDYVDKIKTKHITEELVRNALEKLRKPREAPQDEEVSAEEARAIEKDLEDIAGKTGEVKDLPSDEETTVELNIDQALLMRPSFFEVDSSVERAWNRMILGDFNEAIKLNREARMKTLASFSAFQVYSAAMSIRAAETILNSVAEAKGKLDPGLKTVLASAKKAFIDGHPKRREESLEELESLTAKAYEALIDTTGKAEEELRAQLAEYESFGARTEEPRRLLDIAQQARQAANIAEYARLVKLAREHAEKAKLARKKDLDYNFHIVRAAVGEAKDVGADTSKHEEGLKEAKEALEENSFKKAMELLVSVERSADQAVFEKMASRDVEMKQAEKVQSSLFRYEPDMLEAASYGMDVQEGLLFVRNTRAALSNRDLVNASKFARRLKDVGEPMQKDLDSKRIEMGVIKKVEDAKCGKCGKKSLYTYPNNTQKCLNCGHAFSLAPPPQMGPQAQAPPAAPTVAVQAPPSVPATQPIQPAAATPQAPVSEGEKKEKKRFFRW